MIRIRNVGIAAIAVLAAIAVAQDGFKLRRTPKVGDEVVMKLSAEVDVMGMNATFNAKVKEKVTKVDENGDYTIESSQSEGKIKFGDQEMDAPDGGTTTTKYSANGAILEIKGEDVGEDAIRLANMNAWQFEPKSYKTGDVIEYETKAAATSGGVASKTRIVVGEVEKIGAWDAVKLTYTFKETTGEAPAESSGTAWLDAKTGSLIKAEGEYKNAPFPGAPGPINAKIKLERI